MRAARSLAKEKRQQAAHSKASLRSLPASRKKLSACELSLGMRCLCSWIKPTIDLVIVVPVTAVGVGNAFEQSDSFLTPYLNSRPSLAKDNTLGTNMAGTCL
jgi:hypothetical protein